MTIFTIYLERPNLKLKLVIHIHCVVPANLNMFIIKLNTRRPSGRPDGVNIKCDAFIANETILTLTLWNTELHVKIAHRN
jgi:hypothetical protein